MCVGATSDSGATVATKVDGGGPVRIAVDTDSGMTSPTFFGPVAVDAQGVAKVAATGLDPRTRYWWRVEDGGVVDTSLTGQVLTRPTLGLPASFVVGVGGCSGRFPEPANQGVVGSLAPDRVSNHPVFETIRSRALAEGWQGFTHPGDNPYYDLGSGRHGIVGGGSLDNYRRQWDDVLLQPRQHRLYRELSWSYAWDDHDYGQNDSDGTLPDKANAAAVYREKIPHYTLDDTGAIYQSWRIARVLFILSDVRFYRSPTSDPEGPSKTMLGSAQKSWMDNLLATTDAEFLVWMMPDQWLGTGGDTWGSYTTERAELVEMLGDHGFLDRTVMANADMHALAINSGATSPAGGWPVMVASSLDSQHGSARTGVGDVLDMTPGRNQYGTVGVTDFGNAIVAGLSAYRGTTLMGSHDLSVQLESPIVATGAQVREFAPVVAGSHDPVFEARVLTSFQTGEEPDGVELPIIDGDVQYDSTADVFGTLSLTTVGADPTTGRSRLPRLADDLLAPYGNELFVRRGVDIGSAILWSPLGYFRIETAEQTGTTDSPIQLSGSDRMSGIIEADLVQPREFGPQTTFALLFANLVGDVYPDATVVFDDDSGFFEIGRQLIVDESRYEPLREMVDSLGKTMRWDGDGTLRIESAPSEDAPVWRVAAGRDGVLLDSGRRVTRNGTFNAVVVFGEAGSTDNPVKGVAVDAGPKSPTRWGGRFGRVPHTVQLPTVITTEQATTAAREILRRNLGVNFSADFAAVPNPALRPWHPILVIHDDGSRDTHVVETLTVPLTVGPGMTGTTRERTAIVIGARLT